jgi:hypothetical protein
MAGDEKNWDLMLEEAIRNMENPDEQWDALLEEAIKRAPNAERIVDYFHKGYYNPPSLCAGCGSKSGYDNHAYWTELPCGHVMCQGCIMGSQTMNEERYVVCCVCERPYTEGMVYHGDVCCPGLE